MNSQTKKYMWWEGVTSQTHHKKENFAINMYVNNTNHIVENYSSSCEESKCANYCSQLSKDACEKSVEARRYVAPNGSSDPSPTSTVKRCQWDGTAPHPHCIAGADECASGVQGTQGKGYSCNKYYHAECGRYKYKQKCNKNDGNQDKCKKYYSNNGSKLQLCDWIPTDGTGQCKHTGLDCKEYAYCPTWNC